MREYYLPQFRAAIQAAPARYGQFRGDQRTPVHASKYLLTDVLRKNWVSRG